MYNMTLEGTLGTVATHSGVFHSDDVFAIAALRILDPNLALVRTRDEQKLREADMQVDVGSTYDHEAKMYDHHQTGGAAQRENGVPYSGFGLVWHHYGAEICGSETTAPSVDRSLVQRIDGMDTGYFQVSGADLETPYPLHFAISSFNPSWQDDSPDYDTSFNRAVEFASYILKSEIKEAQGQELATEIVRKAIHHSDGDYLVLDRGCPWKKTAVAESDAKYVIHENSEGKWEAWAVPQEMETRNNRHYFPEEWAGLKGSELQEVSGVDGAVFCHDKRFVAVATTKDGAIQLVTRSLDYSR